MGILSRPGGGIVPFRPDRPEGVVETDVQPQLLREIGEALAVLVQARRLAPLAPDQKLVEDAGQIRRTVRRVGHRFPPF